MFAHAPSDEIRVFHCLNMDVYTSSTTKAFSQVVDTMGYEYCLLIFKAGTMGADTITFDVQFAATAAGTFTAAAGATTTLADADDNTSKAGEVRLHGKDRYMRVGHVAATGSVACEYEVTAVLFGAAKDGGASSGTGDGVGKVVNGTAVGDADTASSFAFSVA